MPSSSLSTAPPGCWREPGTASTGSVWTHTCRAHTSPRYRTGSGSSRRPMPSGPPWPSTTWATRSRRCAPWATGWRPTVCSPWPSGPTRCGCCPTRSTSVAPGWPTGSMGPPRRGSRTCATGLADSAPSADLPTMVAAAGLDVVATRRARLRVDEPLSDDARTFVAGYLHRCREQLTEFLDDEDLAALDVLTDADDPRSVRHRSDVFIAASRQIVIARAAGTPVRRHPTPPEAQAVGRRTVAVPGMSTVPSPSSAQTSSCTTSLVDAAHRRPGTRSRARAPPSAGSAT